MRKIPSHWWRFTRKVFVGGMLGAFLSPSIAFAAAHTFTCTDLSVTVGASCTSGTVILLNNGGNSVASDNTTTPNYPLTIGTTYYWVVSSTGTTGSFIIDENTDAVSNDHVLGYSNVNTQFTTVANVGTYAYLQVWGGTAHSFSDTDANVTSICVSDTSYAECLGGGGGATTTDPIGPVLASTTAIAYTTTGFDIFALASSTGIGMMKLYTGNMLSVLYQERGWIVAMVMIGAVLVFVGRGFRFFRV